VLNGMSRGELERVFGERFERGLSARECLSLASRNYEVFHVVVMEGYAAHGLRQVLASWKPLLPGRVLLLHDYRRLAEVVVSAIQVAEGEDPRTVAGSWTGGAGAVVAKALADLKPRPTGGLRWLLG